MTSTLNTATHSKPAVARSTEFSAEELSQIYAVYGSSSRSTSPHQGRIWVPTPDGLVSVK